MATDSRYEDFRDRVRTLESGAEGDRLVHIRLLEQQQRLTAELITVRGAVDVLSGQSNKLTDDMAIVKATQIRHGRALDVLTQDVRQIRQDMATREEVTLINARLDQMQGRLDQMDGRLDHMQGQSDARHAELLAAIRALGSSSAHPA
jgi:septal ring factor EnvC (AmiA/AmiB activator)